MAFDNGESEKKAKGVTKEKQHKRMRRAGQRDAKVITQSDKRVRHLAEARNIDLDWNGNPRSAEDLRDDISRTGQQSLAILSTLGRRKKRP